MSTPETVGFKFSELNLNYLEFVKLSEEKSNNLDQDTKEWLDCWKKFDLTNSPMDDDKRKILRYGHYLGFMESKKDKEPKYDTRRTNPPCQKGLNVLEQLRKSIVKVSKFMREDEGRNKCLPMYKMGLILHEISNEYMANRNICLYETYTDDQYNKTFFE